MSTQYYNLLRSGKVRDIYEYDKDHLLIHTSNRISAFDVVLPDEIPGKGEVLQSLSNYWMGYFSNLISNQFTNFPVPQGFNPKQAMVVKKLNPLPVEAIVRGYLIGSGWKEYQEIGSVCGIRLPDNLQMAEELPDPIFTPSTKADVGEHDINISFKRMEELIGGLTASEVQMYSLAIYKAAAAKALKKGIIIADTKLEFGLDADGRLHLIDEVLTPDSSRFWSVDEYTVGISPPSYDKQIVRDYLETLDWDKKAPGPSLPQEIIDKTENKYKEIKNRLIS